MGILGTGQAAGSKRRATTKRMVKNGKAKAWMQRAFVTLSLVGFVGMTGVRLVRQFRAIPTQSTTTPTTPTPGLPTPKPPTIEEEMASYQVILNREPDNYIALEELMRLHMQGGQWSKALGFADHLLALDPTNDFYQQQQAIIKEQLQKTQPTP